MSHHGLVALASFIALSAPASADLRFYDRLPGTFIDIAATGTTLLLPNDGEANIVTTVGNSLFPAGTVRIGVNGGVRFGPANAGQGDLAPSNAALPSTGAFGGAKALLPYWDDFIANNGPLVFGSIQHEERNGVFIVQWTNVKLRSAAVQDRITFQLQVPSTGPVLARFVYPDILGAAGGGSSATIGYQGADVTLSAQHSLDANKALRNGTVLSLLEIGSNRLAEDIPGAFVDISNTGTPLALTGTQNAIVNTSVRNSLVTEPRLLIGLNGAIGIDSSSNLLTNSNATLPSANLFGGERAFVPFWDDLESNGGSLGAVYHQELADRFVVQWNAVGFGGAPASERVTFQVQIFDSSPLLAQYIYADVEGARAARGASATIGYQGTGVPPLTPHSFNAASVRNGTVLSLIGTPQLGTNYCIATNNSTGVPSRISARGNNVISNNNMFLDAFDLPLNSAAFFIVSRQAGFVPLAGGSQGNLCLSGGIGRGVGNIVNSGSTGRAINVVDLLSMPSPTGRFAVAAGDTLSFQCWHRDVVGGTPTSNFTNALQVQFEP